MKDAEDQKMKYFSSNFFIFLPILLAFFFMLGAGIFDLDEGVFASTSLQMLLDQQYLIPYIGENARLEKPILSYWIQALSMTIFGINEVALRLPSLIAGIFWIYVFGKFVSQRTESIKIFGIVSTFFSVPALFLISFIATADAFLNLFLTLLMISLYKFYESNDKKFVNAAAIYLSLGFLTKGLTVIAIGGLVFFIFLLVRNKLAVFFRAITNINPWIIFIVLGLSWFIFLYLRLGPDAVNYLLFGQSFGRFSQSFENHSGPIYYYILLLPFLLMPLTLNFVRGISQQNFKNSALDQFLLVWFLVVLIFFSFSTTKLPHYLVYGLTPAAYFVEKALQSRDEKTNMLFPIIFTILFWCICLTLPYILHYAVSLNPTFDINLEILEAFKSDYFYRFYILTFLLLLFLFFIFGRNNLKIGFIERLSSSVFILLLSFSILPMIHSATQDDIKKLGEYAKDDYREISMYKINKPSFAFYAGKKANRGLREDSLILTRIDKVEEFRFNYEILKTSGNYLIITIGAD